MQKILFVLFFCFVSKTLSNEKKIKLSDEIKEIYQNPLANGFGEDIKWIKWENAIETALEVDKPIFLLIHKNWCHACRSLKKSFQQSNARKAFTLLSEYFVMVNTVDDEEPYEEEYRPDGKYIPRLLFLDKNGDALLEFKNKKAEYKNYSYYYSSPADILNSMKDVLNHFGIEIPKPKKGEKLQSKKLAKSQSAPEGPEIKVPKKPTDDKIVAEPDIIDKAQNAENKKKSNAPNAEKMKTKNEKSNKKSEL